MNKTDPNRGMSEWLDAEHAEQYLQIADELPHRAHGEAALLEQIPSDVRAVLDLGTGDGRLLAMVLEKCPDARAAAIDFSPPMLARFQVRFAAEQRVALVEHDLQKPLPELGQFNAVVSSFAIHHVDHVRKRQLYGEILDILRPGGVFCNLEHVSSATLRLHQEFLKALGVAQEDPSNQLLDVETQLGWLREIGFEDVDCLWKWRELALLTGRRPREKSL